MSLLKFSCAALMIFSFQQGWSEKPCALCEKVREHNAQHPENNYFWYDDYLKDQGNQEGKEKPLEAQASQAEKSSSLF